MIVKQHATPYRANARNEGDTRVSQSENGQRGVGGRDRVDGHRYRPWGDSAALCALYGFDITL